MIRKILAVVFLFVLWTAIDIVVHGNLLMDAYHDTAHLWRPEEDMRMWAMSVSNVVGVICFTLIYGCFFSDKSLGRATMFGLIYGVAKAAAMGLGVWSYTPITVCIAQVWAISELIRYTLSGALLGVIVRD